MFINRNYSRTESDDFKLNVADKIKENGLEAVPVHNPGDGQLVGWKIQSRYE